MTRKEKAMGQLKFMLEQMPEEPPSECDYIEEWFDTDREIRSAFKMAIEALEQEPCEDAVSREAALDAIFNIGMCTCSTKEVEVASECLRAVEALPPVKMGHCKDCKYFEYDSFAKVDEIPLIVAHEICKKWGNGCKTKEDGYCFLFELRESEGKED